MMKTIIFGTGRTGMIAADFIGWGRIEYFIDTNKAGGYLGDKKIISLESHVAGNIIDSCIIIICSEYYWEEIEHQVLEAGINKYFVFHESDVNDIKYILPGYDLYKQRIRKNFNEVLARYSFSKYSCIGIIGYSRFIPYLLLDLNERVGLEKCILITCNDENNTQSVLGLEVKRLTDYWDKLDCLIIGVCRTDSIVRNIISKKEHEFAVVDLYQVDKFEPLFHHNELIKFKNIYKGKRVFLVGNGPSIKLEDLEMLYKNHEVCFGCNKVFRIYPKTKWRADYLCMADHRTVSACQEEIPKLDGVIFLADTYHSNMIPIFDNVHYVHMIGEQFNPNLPGFSDDITYGVYMGWNIVYDLMIQIAAYMGFSEMYLLGVDHQLSDRPMEDGNHFVDNYFSEEEKRVVQFDQYAFDMNSKTLGYKMAELYSRKKGFRIYNATRGGALEVFERVEFDSLF